MMTAYGWAHLSFTKREDRRPREEPMKEKKQRLIERKLSALFFSLVLSLNEASSDLLFCKRKEITANLSANDSILFIHKREKVNEMLSADKLIAVILKEKEKSIISLPTIFSLLICWQERD
jgi:hypothetical protein